MNGPRIIRIDAPEQPKRTRSKHATRKPTGIRKQPQTGQWAAIRNGRLVSEYGTGINGRRVAIRVAGTDQEV